jgi:hypothetical protein
MDRGRAYLEGDLDAEDLKISTRSEKAVYSPPSGTASPSASSFTDERLSPRGRTR